MRLVELDDVDAGELRARASSLRIVANSHASFSRLL
jgi:hypothetical protein